MRMSIGYLEPLVFMAVEIKEQKGSHCSVEIQTGRLKEKKKRLFFGGFHWADS